MVKRRVFQSFSFQPWELHHCLRAWSNHLPFPQQRGQLKFIRSWWNWRVVNFHIHSSRWFFFCTAVVHGCKSWSFVEKPWNLGEKSPETHLKNIHQNWIMSPNRKWKQKSLWSFTTWSPLGILGHFSSPQVHLDHPCWQDQCPSPYHQGWLIGGVDLKQEIGIFHFKKTCLQTIMAKKKTPLFQVLKLCSSKKTQQIQQSCTEKNTPVSFSNASHGGPRQLQVLWHTLLLPCGSAPKVASNRVTPSGFPGTKLPGFEVKPTIEKYSFFGIYGWNKSLLKPIVFMGNCHSWK